MFGLRGLRSLCGCKVFTVCSLYQPRQLFTRSSKVGTVTETKEKLPSRDHRRATWLGTVTPRHRVNLENVSVYPARWWHTELIFNFLMEHYWPREPITTGLYMCVHSPYLEQLTCHFIKTGDTLMAVEHLPGGCSMLIGVCIGQVLFRMDAFELFRMGAYSRYTLEGIRLLFISDCLRKANTIDEYDVPCLYHVEVLATHYALGKQGVGSLLLETVLSAAKREKYPMLQVLATNLYAAKICERLKMKKEMSMPYRAYTDVYERLLIYSREPHDSAAVYTLNLNRKH